MKHVDATITQPDANPQRRVVVVVAVDEAVCHSPTNRELRIFGATVVAAAQAKLDDVGRCQAISKRTGWPCERHAVAGGYCRTHRHQANDGSR